MLEKCCYEATEVLVEAMGKENGGKSVGSVERGVVVLGYLIGLLCEERGVVVSSSETSKEKTEEEEEEKDDVDPKEVKEGDTLWYVTNPTDPPSSTRTKATVEKIHRDDFPNLYFTVRLSNDDSNRDGAEDGAPPSPKEEPVVKQTVAERLKRFPHPPPPSPSPPTPLEGMGPFPWKDRRGE